MRGPTSSTGRTAKIAGEQSDEVDLKDLKYLTFLISRFLDLKKELSSFQREAEESDRVVNDFIKVLNLDTFFGSPVAIIPAGRGS